MLVRYQGWRIILNAIFPLVGLFILIASFVIGRPFGPLEILVVLSAFFFTPLIIAVTVWAGRRNKLRQGPFTYTFDAEGMHSSGAAFSQTIKWSAIPRVRRTKRFLLVFIAPAQAHCIPLKDVNDLEALETLRALANVHSNYQ